METERKRSNQGLLLFGRLWILIVEKLTHCLHNSWIKSIPAKTIVYNWPNSTKAEQGWEAWPLDIWLPWICQFVHLLGIWIYKWPRGEQGEGVQPWTGENPRLPAQDHPAFGKFSEFPASGQPQLNTSSCHEHAENYKGSWEGGGGGGTVTSLSPSPKAQADDSQRWISNGCRGGCSHPRPSQRARAIISPSRGEEV